MTCSLVESVVRISRNLLTGCGLMLAVLACQSIDPSLRPEALLPNSAWRLVAMDDLPLEDRSLPEIEFAVANIAGDTGCNRYSAKMTLSDDSISFGPIKISRAACTEIVEAREVRYIEQLTEAYHIEVSLDFLQIYCANAEFPLRFVRIR